MKVLIVEDNNNKAADIKNTILKENENIENDIAAGKNEALAKMREKKYDLLILDMCIPNDFGNQIDQEGGIDLIDKIFKDKKIIAPPEIIVLTAYEDKIKEHENIIKNKSFQMIHYNSSSIEWQKKIEEKVKYLCRVSDSPEEKRKYRYDVAIITAVEVEKNAVKEILDWKRKEIEGDLSIYYEAELDVANKKIKIIHTTLPQMGMTAAATSTTKIIHHFSPRFIIMPGISAGLKSEYNFGDIVMPNEVKDYCSGKYTTPKDREKEAIINPLSCFVPSGNSISTDRELFKLIEEFKNDLIEVYNTSPYRSKYCAPEIRTGNMVSGDSVIQNSIVTEEMVRKHLRNADGLDMEAYGMYYAVQEAISPRPKAICIKAISDFADREKSDDAQPHAAYISARFLKKIIERIVV